MRFFTQLIVALFSMLAAVDATGPSGGAHWKEWCSVGYPGMYNTINRFCSQFGSGFTVPNAKAAAGLHSSTAYKSMTWAGVTGNCNPPQWVPIVWCYTQFYHLCYATSHGINWANRDFIKEGIVYEGHDNVGNGACQSFQLHYSTSWGNRCPNGARQPNGVCI